MKRRHWILLVVATVALAGVIGGSVIAIGGGGDTGSGGRPDAAGTVLRIEPLEDEVACGPGPVVVNIYLDDLAARPSPRNAEASYGVGSFEFPLRYDPALLRLGEPADIVLNPGLDAEDADGDGVVRAFIPVMHIDDGAGFAALGAASFNPSSHGSPEANREEGLDPVAKGEPLLLMTVRFQSVGHGVSALSMDPRDDRAEPLVPTLLDPEGKPYEPVTVEGATVTVRDGECPDVALATPRPTLDPTSTPYAPPTMTPVPWKTVTAPDAVSTGRTDCPEDWVAYADPEDRFSVCFPSDYDSTASDFSLNAHSAQTPGQTEKQIGLVVSWGERPYFSLPPSPENCALVADPLLGPQSSLATTLEISGRSVAACLTEGGSSTIQGATPLARDESDAAGFIRFTLTYSNSDADTPSKAMDVLNTLEIDFR